MLDPRIDKIRQTYGLDKDDFWKLPQGRDVWLVKHAALEAVAVKAGIEFEEPQIIEADGANGVAALYVRGHLDKKSVWSTGEANPKNCRNAYPWAIAEKRAIDRVILKLVGLHGLVYSEEESDDFKSNGADPETPPKSSAQLKRDDAWNKMMFRVSADLGDVKTPQQLEEVKAHWREVAKSEGWTRAWMSALGNEFDQFQDQMIANLEKEEA